VDFLPRVDIFDLAMKKVNQRLEAVDEE